MCEIGGDVGPLSNTYTIDTHKEGEHINVSKVHLVCGVMTLCVADTIWGACRDLYTLLYRYLTKPRLIMFGFLLLL